MEKTDQYPSSSRSQSIVHPAFYREAVAHRGASVQPIAGLADYVAECKRDDEERRKRKLARRLQQEKRDAG